jgi:hypothetical protein
MRGRTELELVERMVERYKHGDNARVKQSRCSQGGHGNGNRGVLQACDCVSIRQT